MLEKTGEFIIQSSNLVWGAPLLILLLGGGLFFLVYSRLAPLRYIGHAISILTGKYDNPNEPGQLKHYEALSTALATTAVESCAKVKTGKTIDNPTGKPIYFRYFFIIALILNIIELLFII